MIGITERGDAALDTSWIERVNLGLPSILITKDPAKLLTCLNSTMNIIVHCTITGMGGTSVEPNVPKMENAIAGYHQLLEMFGKNRICLRIDPIFPTDKGIAIALKVIQLAQPETFVRISFIDAYPHVRERFTRPFPWVGMHAPLEMRRKAYNAITNALGFEPDVCAEPGFECTGCVSSADAWVLGHEFSAKSGKQRAECKCVAAKTELLTTKGQCAHGCLYCYWR